MCLKLSAGGAEVCSCRAEQFTAHCFKRVPEGWRVMVAIAISLIPKLFVPYLCVTDHLFDMNSGQCSDKKSNTGHPCPVIEMTLVSVVISVTTVNESSVVSELISVTTDVPRRRQ